MRARKGIAGVLVGSVMVIPLAGHAVPVATDVVLLVDESGSMSGEHAWIPDMVRSLENELVAAGVGSGATPNRYAIVGFGTYVHGGGINQLPPNPNLYQVPPSQLPYVQVPHKHTVGGADWFGAGDIGSLDDPLVTAGNFEDGWSALDFFFSNYSVRPGTALNVILITDEDRDSLDSTLSYNSVLNQLLSRNALLNVVVDCALLDGSGSPALGVDSGANNPGGVQMAYVADGSGGFTTASGGTAGTPCDGTTKADYIDMAWASGGAAWDLNLLRAGGATADSFTQAFISVKVAEIQNQPPAQEIPEPVSLALLGAGLVGFGTARRWRSRV